MNYAVNIRKQKNIHSELIKTNFPITYKYKYKDNGKVIEKKYTSTILNELFFHPNRYSKNTFVSWTYDATHFNERTN